MESDHFDPVGSPVDMVQYLYWHIIGSGETGFGGPRFAFMLTGDGMPENCKTANTPGCFRATAVGINYTGTCTQDTPLPCPLSDPGVVTAGNPISGFATGTLMGSTTVASSGTVSIPSDGVALAAYGSDDTNVYIGQSGIQLVRFPTATRRLAESAVLD